MQPEELREIVERFDELRLAYVFGSVATKSSPAETAVEERVRVY